MRPNVGTNEIDEIKKVIKSKFLTEGKVTEKFEKEISQYINCKYSIATTSATTALHTMFSCMNVKGKDVLVSDFTFPATALAIIQSGGKPVLMDVEKSSMNVNRKIAENALNEKIEFLAPVSLFGNPLELDFFKFRKQGKKIIEDAATNLGTKINEKFVGTFADATCFSFHPRKIITTGEGGMIVTNNKELAKKFRTFKMFGKTDNNFSDFGTNYKLSDIQSAIGICQLKKIEKIIKKRIKLAQYYKELISKIECIEIQQKTKNSRHTYQSFTCYITKPNLRNKIIKNLSKNNIESQIGTYALHCLPAFKKCRKIGKLENSRYLFENSISLPLHEELNQKDQERICKIIKKTVNYGN